MANVEVYLDSDLTPEEILSFGFQRVILATGAHWRSDGIGGTNWKPIPGSDQDHEFSPEYIFNGGELEGPVVVFDDDNFCMGAIIAEKLKQNGNEVTFITTASEVSPWTHNTLEQHRIQARVLEMGINVITSHNIFRINKSELDISCGYTGKMSTAMAASVVMVTSRRPNNKLSIVLADDGVDLDAAGISSITSIGDCLNPSTIAVAVYEGHRIAREMDAPPDIRICRFDAKRP